MKRCDATRLSFSKSAGSLSQSISSYEMRPRPKNLILKNHQTSRHTNYSTTSGEETSTADNLISELQSNRIKRAAGEVDEGGGVLRRACNRFQIEVCIKQCTKHAHTQFDSTAHDSDSDSDAVNSDRDRYDAHRLMLAFSLHLLLRRKGGSRFQSMHRKVWSSSIELQANCPTTSLRNFRWALKGGDYLQVYISETLDFRLQASP